MPEEIKPLSSEEVNTAVRGVIEEVVSNITESRDAIAAERDELQRQLNAARLLEPICSLCGSPAEYRAEEKLWRHRGQPFEKGYERQQFCDKYGYPIIPIQMAKLRRIAGGEK